MSAFASLGASIAHSQRPFLLWLLRAPPDKCRKQIDAYTAASEALFRSLSSRSPRVKLEGSMVAVIGVGPFNSCSRVERVLAKLNIPTNGRWCRWSPSPAAAIQSRSLLNRLAFSLTTLVRARCVTLRYPSEHLKIFAWQLLCRASGRCTWLLCFHKQKPNPHCSWFLLLA